MKQLICFLVLCSLLPVAVHGTSQSETIIMESYVIDVAGNTLNNSSAVLFYCMGESFTGQVASVSSAVQSGFFNDYYQKPATPTVTPTNTATPTVTVTTTPIRQFGDELLAKKWIYAAPHPIRGSHARIVYHLAKPAEVEIKLFNTNNQLVISKKWNNVAAGENAWQWHTGDQVNGVYLMLIKAKSDTGKITVIKKRLALIK